MRKALQFTLFALVLTVCTTLEAQDNVGIASYNSDSFQGRETASGERYDKNQLTAAHKTLAFGTYLKVTRLDNKRSVTVRVNDRGPYIRGRIVDLSRKAAEALNLITDGHANVKIEVVDASEAATARTNRPPTTEGSSQAVEQPRIESTSTADAAASTPSSYEATPVERKNPLMVSGAKPSNGAGNGTATNARTGNGSGKVAPPTTPAPQRTPAPAASEPFAPGTTVVKGSNYKDYDLYKIQLMRPERNGFGVQIASLTKYENVMKQVAQLQEKFFKNVLLSIEPNGDKPVYKIILGPFPDAATAESYKKQLKKKKKMNGFVVDLTQIDYNSVK